ncbi:MAG: hypothetical protein V4676_09600 [Bacteroidota bacterium]
MPKLSRIDTTPGKLLVQNPVLCHLPICFKKGRKERAPWLMNNHLIILPYSSVPNHAYLLHLWLGPKFL